MCNSPHKSKMYKWLFHTLDSLTKEDLNTQILRRQTKNYTYEKTTILNWRFY